MKCARIRGYGNPEIAMGRGVNGRLSVHRDGVGPCGAFSLPRRSGANKNNYVRRGSYGAAYRSILYGGESVIEVVRAGTDLGCGHNDNEGFALLGHFSVLSPEFY